MTSEQAKEYIRSLLREREGYANDKDRLAAVDAELKRLGATAETPVKRAAKRANGRD